MYSSRPFIWLLPPLDFTWQFQTAALSRCFNGCLVTHLLADWLTNFIYLFTDLVRSSSLQKSALRPAPDSAWISTASTDITTPLVRGFMLLLLLMMMMLSLMMCNLSSAFLPSRKRLFLVMWHSNDILWCDIRCVTLSCCVTLLSDLFHVTFCATLNAPIPCLRPFLT